MVAATLTDGVPNAPLMAVPVPLAPVAPMKYSAAVTLLLPLNWSLTSQGRHYVFPWDTFASGFFGSTDNLVFRISAK